MHAILSWWTAGAWLVIWFLCALVPAPWQCDECHSYSVMDEKPAPRKPMSPLDHLESWLWGIITIEVALLLLVGGVRGCVWLVHQAG